MSLTIEKRREAWAGKVASQETSGKWQAERDEETAIEHKKATIRPQGGVGEDHIITFNVKRNVLTTQRRDTCHKRSTD